MNWQVEITARETIAAGQRVFMETQHSDADVLPPDVELIDAAWRAADEVVRALGGEVVVSIQGHEMLAGTGFAPAHLVITVSRLDPERGGVHVDADASPLTPH
jgi:hypothetical protein